MTTSNPLHQFVSEVRFGPEPQGVTLGRYPFIYAYDFMRSHQQELLRVPEFKVAVNTLDNRVQVLGGMMMSRGEASRVLREVVGGDSTQEKYVIAACYLADQYIAEHNLLWRVGQGTRRWHAAINVARNHLGSTPPVWVTRWIETERY